MKSALLSPETLQIANEIMAWLTEHLASEKDELKRPRGSQVVCPFIKPAIDNDSMYLAFHPEINGRSLTHLTQTVLSYIDFFKKLSPFAPNERYKKALLLIFPEISAKEATILDLLQAQVKDDYVREGLMIGQFHPNCQEPSIYNRKFLVSVSPYPLVAIRHMALHDILFLGNKKEWFMHFNSWFGERFIENQLGEINSHLLTYYLEAKGKYKL